MTQMNERPVRIRYRRDGTIDTEHYLRHGHAVRSATIYEALRPLCSRLLRAFALPDSTAEMASRRRRS